MLAGDSHASFLSRSQMELVLIGSRAMTSTATTATCRLRLYEILSSAACSKHVIAEFTGGHERDVCLDTCNGICNEVRYVRPIYAKCGARSIPKAIWKAHAETFVV